ncbi:MAG: hypothetical protein EOO73_18900 [Myxococcales bacterium]|nr:MAG: hypothetical protein EOO73_18900 [Myxococcales bacterium]
MKRALLVGVGTLFIPALAHAEGSVAPSAALDPDAPPPSVHLVDDSDPEPTFTPRAKDLLGSHVLVGAGIAPAWSIGELGSRLPTTRGLGVGFSARADAGFGISRSVVVGAWGGFSGFSDGRRCDSCSGRALSVGPFVRYHLAQGFRFNPWLMMGAAYRQLSFVDASGDRQKFSGVEWLHLELGADYYALSGVGFGPYGALGLSTYGSRPDAAGDASVNVDLSVGLRFFLDLPGR